MMDPGVEIALIVSCGTCFGILGTSLSQTFIARLTSNDRHKERLEDWNRQDAVAEKLLKQQEATTAATEATVLKAAEAARLLVESNKNFALHAAETAKILLASNNGIKKDIAVVHGLVNSALTTEKQAVYDGYVRELLLMQHMIALDHDAGRSPNESMLEAIENTHKRMSELKNELEDRAKETTVLNFLDKVGQAKIDENT